MRYHADPFARSVATSVLACTPAGGGWDVTLTDTVLYPEGGGQPDDHGTVAGQRVLGLRKEGGAVVHRLAAPVEGAVTVEVDWARRFDHMQQHSGQHLLSAIAHDRFGLPTTAFHLGAERCAIEVDGDGEVVADTLSELEAAVNEAIRDDRPVHVREVTVAEMAALPVRTRGLPEGFVGSVRLVEIAGIDLNTCGGTHVDRTGRLQAIKLLGVERMKRGTRIPFVAGGRVLGLLGDTLAREAALVRLLSCPPTEHATSVARALDETRAWAKAARALSAELAHAIGGALLPTGDTLRWHRDDADPAFLNAVADAVRARFPEVVCVLTGGVREGVFLVAGPDARVAALGPKVAATFEGRGGGARGKFQGKAARVDRPLD
ncbi:MAG: alanyl-tRNA editing protein [Myxococcota bacterium]